MTASDKKSPTSLVWNALQKLSLRYFHELRKRHQHWTLDELFLDLNLPRTALLIDLAQQAGFRHRIMPSAENVGAVAEKLLRGIDSVQIIASDLGISSEAVKVAIELCNKGYGSTPYGHLPYGSNRKTSDGKSAVTRRVTTVGQMSYGGKTYTLGAAYRGRMVQVRERGAQLLITFSDRSPIYLTRRC